MIHQIWINLISNAIKFSNINGDIEISGKKVDNNIVVKFSDYGIVISNDSIKRIYDKFYQADASHSTIGNGLGLSIVQEIIKLHKGNIQVESEINKGTTFTVYLPIKETYYYKSQEKIEK